MSGLLQGIIGVVGIAAAVLTVNPALGIASGALLVSDAAQQGWLGKGPKNFFNSAAGHDLTMAIGLASAAMSVSSLMSATATTTASSAVTAANDAAETTEGADQGLTAAQQAAAATGGDASGVAAPSGMGDAAPAATPGASLQANLTNPSGQISAAQNGYPGIAASPATTNAVNQMSDNSSLINGGGGAGSANGSAPNDVIQQMKNNDPALNQAANSNASGVSADQAAVQPGGVASGPGESALQTNMAGPAATPTQGGQPTGLSAVGSKIGGALSTPTGMLMAGQAISGLAQGKAAESIAQRQLAAQQWGNIQWTDPNQIAQLNAAAAAPVTVPQGYLARAAAARNLVNGGTNQTAPLQSSPTAPPAAAPTVQPLGMGNPGGGGANPVPIAAMSATPRGGVI